MKHIDHLILENAVDAIGVFPQAVSNGKTRKERTEFEEGWNEASFQILNNIDNMRDWFDKVENKNELHNLLNDNVISLDSEANGVTMWVNVNDTFYYATADAEQIEEDDLKILSEVYDRWGYDGVVAFVADKRHKRPLDALITVSYEEAIKYLT